MFIDEVKRYESNVETAVGRCGRSERWDTDELVQTVQERAGGDGLAAWHAGVASEDSQVYRRDTLH